MITFEVVDLEPSEGLVDQHVDNSGAFGASIHVIANINHHFSQACSISGSFHDL